MKDYGLRQLRLRARHEAGDVLGLSLPPELIRDMGLRAGDMVKVERVGPDLIRLRLVKRAPREEPPEKAVRAAEFVLGAGTKTMPPSGVEEVLREEIRRIR